jgi:hypothetical protein
MIIDEFRVINVNQDYVKYIYKQNILTDSGQIQTKIKGIASKECRIVQFAWTLPGLHHNIGDHGSGRKQYQPADS